MNKYPKGISDGIKYVMRCHFFFFLFFYFLSLSPPIILFFYLFFIITYYIAYVSYGNRSYVISYFRCCHSSFSLYRSRSLTRLILFSSPLIYFMCVLLLVVLAFREQDKFLVIAQMMLLKACDYVVYVFLVHVYVKRHKRPAFDVRTILQ